MFVCFVCVACAHGVTDSEILVVLTCLLIAVCCCCCCFDECKCLLFLHACDCFYVCIQVFECVVCAHGVRACE